MRSVDLVTCNNTSMLNVGDSFIQKTFPVPSSAGHTVLLCSKEQMQTSACIKTRAEGLKVVLFYELCVESLWINLIEDSSSHMN